MAELTQGERLQPSLLDRLTDEYPERQKRIQAASAPGAERGETPEEPEADPQYERVERNLRTRDAKYVINSRQLRDYVKRDLAWLLNTGCLEDALDLSDFPNVADSVLNFGMPDLTGLVASSVDAHTIERRLVKAITRFEPRILKRSLRVKISTSEAMSGNALRFDIECDVWGQPTPERVHLHSELDLEDGTFKLQDHTG